MGEPPPQRRRIATALFCDLVGSTATAERADSEAVLALMLRYFEQVRAAIERHGGTVEKFIGDAVVGLFGLPVAHDDDALRALRAAVEARDRLAALDVEHTYGEPVAVRIGVNTGEVTTAADPLSGAPLVVADAVNVAARLQQAAAPGEIVLGELTHRLVGAEVRAERLPALTAKGKTEPLTAYRLLRVVDTAGTIDRHSGRPILGRGEQLETLAAAYGEVVETGRGRLVTVVGEAGIGKSRLAYELAARLGTEPTVAYGAIPAYGDAVAHRALGQVLRSLAGVEPGDTDDVALAKLAALSGGRMADSVGPALGLRPGVVTPGEITAGVRALLEGAAGAQPLVAIFDDVHWAEAAFIELLEGVAANLNAPVLLVCLARPDVLDGHPGWPVTIALGPLGDADAARFLDSLLGPGHPVAGRVAAAAQGNPLFLEQLAAMLVDEGAGAGDGGAGAQPNGAVPGAVALPASLSVLLTARLDRLPATERVVVERAAVEGATFHVDAVAALCSDAVSATAIEPAIAGLVARQFVEPDPVAPPGRPGLRFRNVLVCEAAYAGTSKSLRARLHEEYAAWLGTSASSRTADHADIVGHHLECAFRLRSDLGPLDDAARDLGARAGALLAATGRRALDRGDVASAAALGRRALDLLPPGSDLRPGVTFALGVALTEIGELDRAALLLAEAATAAGAVGDERLQAHAHLELTWVRGMSDTTVTLSDMRAIARRAVAIGERTSDDALLARAHYLLGNQLFASELHAQAADAFDHALGHARRTHDHRAEADALYFYGCSVFFGPAPVADAVPAWEELFGAARARPALEASAATGLALLRALQGRFADARELIARTFVIYDDLGMAVHRAGNEYTLVEVELLAGDWEAAQIAARSGSERLLALGDRAFAPGGLLYLAAIAEITGRHDDVGRYVEAGGELAEADDTQSWGRIHALRGTVLARQGFIEDGLAELDTAERVFGATETPGSLAETLLWRARVLRLAGRDGEAESAVRRALDLYERKGNVPAARRTRALLTTPSPSPPSP